MVDAFFPLKSVKIQDDDKPFINGRIKQLIQKRDKAYQLGRVDQSKKLRNLIVAEIRKAKRVFYEQNIKPFHNQNSKKWWENVKHIVGNKRQNFDLSDPLLDAPIRDVATGGVWGGVTPPPTNTSGKNQVKSQKVKKKNQVNLRSTYTSKQ